MAEQKLQKFKLPDSRDAYLALNLNLTVNNVNVHLK